MFLHGQVDTIMTMDDSFQNAAFACGMDSYGLDLPPTPLTAEQLQDLKRKYSSLLLQLDKLQPGLVRCDLTLRDGPRSWSIKEILGHLIDSDRSIWWPRIDALLQQESPTFQSIDQDILIRKNNWQQLPLEDILSQLMRVRWSFAVRLNELPDNVFSRSGVHYSLGDVSISRILQLLVAHDAHYLEKIRLLIARGETVE